MVTGDALLTQREIARHIVEDKHADFVFTAKDNQPTLRKDISDLFAMQEQEAKRRQQAARKKPPEREAFPPQHRTDDKGHGRLETRELWTSTELNGYLDFPHVGQVFCIRRTTTDLNGHVVKGRKSTVETIYGLTSLPPHRGSPAQVLGHNRAHWEIENRLHYVRDMTYDEDRSQVRKRQLHTRYLGRQVERPLRLIGVV